MDPDRIGSCHWVTHASKAHGCSCTGTAAHWCIPKQYLSDASWLPMPFSICLGRFTQCSACPGYGQEYADRPEALDYPSTGYNTEGRVEVIVPVPDSRIGAIIGKKGEVINQLKALCDVRIRISDRDDFVPGTRNRKVSISGTAEAVGITQALIRQRLRASPQPLQYDDRRSPATAL